MENATYVTLTRQSGLLKELQVVANNIANASTTGYRAEGVVFAEMVRALPTEGGAVAMTDARVRYTAAINGVLTKTNGTFDLGIQGEGFFLIETPTGERLTRRGAFTVSPENELITLDGDRVLDAGGAPLFVPPDAAQVNIGADGTMSADGRPVAQIGLFTVQDPADLVRKDGTTFIADAPLLPADGATVSQGFLEGSNVNPVVEITRMIEVQRAYELGQKLLDGEDERVRAVVRSLGAAT